MLQPLYEVSEASRETHAADAESAAADEEAAGSEEMSKLLQEYDEKQEAAASHEVIEVKVVAYTEHGVVVDLGGKTEGLIPRRNSPTRKSRGPSRTALSKCSAPASTRTASRSCLT